MFKHIAFKKISSLMHRIPKMYSQPGVMYFVEPYNSELEQLTNDFMTALHENNKSECLDILQNIEILVKKLTPQIGIIFSKLEANKILNFISLITPMTVKTEFVFMIEKQRQLQLVKILIKYYFR